MDEKDLAYIAGFFDGEGCAFISMVKARNGKRYPRVTAKIAQKDREVLEWIREQFGFGNVQPKPNDDPSQCYYVVFAYKQARVFLTAIEPYLRVKKKHVSATLDITGREQVT